MSENPNCDGSGPHTAAGTQVRVLPLGGDGNLILCLYCFNREIDYRKTRNRDLGEFAKFDLPTWASLKTYSA